MKRMIISIGIVTFAINIAVINVVRASRPESVKLKHGKLLYKPVEKEFRSVYEKDVRNKQVQRWDEYWDWIKKFYGGTWLTKGWNQQADKLLAAVTNYEAREQVATEINRLGKLVAGEWAKDNNVRKITTGDVRKWGKALNQAREKEKGSGRVLATKLISILMEAETKLRLGLKEFEFTPVEFKALRQFWKMYEEMLKDRKDLCLSKRLSDTSLTLKVRMFRSGK